MARQIVSDFTQQAKPHKPIALAQMKTDSLPTIYGNLDKHQRRTMAIVIAYPITVIMLAILINVFILTVVPFSLAMPYPDAISALAIATVLLTINHSWIMTATELVRVRYKMYATPEEWQESGTSPKNTSDIAIRELERVHNAHRNSTENTVLFLALLIPFTFSSPTTIATYAWPIIFSLSRLGYTYSYLSGKTGLRGLFMSLTLLASYGIASYLILSLALK